MRRMLNIYCYLLFSSYGYTLVYQETHVKDYINMSMQTDTIYTGLLDVYINCIYLFKSLIPMLIKDRADLFVRNLGIWKRRPEGRILNSSKRGCVESAHIFVANWIVCRSPIETISSKRTPAILPAVFITLFILFLFRRDRAPAQQGHEKARMLWINIV